MQKSYRLILVLGVVGAFLIVGAISIAQTSDTVYYGCLADNGKISEITTEVAPVCPNNTTLITWNETGPEGPEGPPGPEGPAGADGVDGVDGVDGEDGVAGGGMFSPLSATVFGVTSDGCPANQWRLDVISQSGVTLTWDTSTCVEMRDDGWGPGPNPFVQLSAFADSKEATELNGASYFGPGSLRGKITHIDGETWRMDCDHNVQGTPRNLTDPETSVVCQVFTENVDPAHFAEILDTGGLESQSIIFFK